MPHIVILLLFLVLTPSLSLGASVSLKLGHIAETSNPYAKAAEYFAELVKQRSQGKMEVQVYPAGKLGTQRDLIEGL
ncbi:MAG: C4-dicarboxylate ABC transporter substrate-binding protein, partial [Desulfovibrio sp.]|nr:C4-dicarboxylate ABC transporter substrate-binding protein [Desulfovibrio sp.]